MSAGDPLRKIARDASRFEAEWPLAGARIIAAEASRQAASATGGDGRLSRWKSIGAATVDVSGGNGQATVTGQGGLWSVLENGTTAHEAAAASASPRDALRTPYGPRRRVRVKGVPGKNTWTRAMLTAERQVTTATNAALDRIGS